MPRLNLDNISASNTASNFYADIINSDSTVGLDALSSGNYTESAIRVADNHAATGFEQKPKMPAMYQRNSPLDTRIKVSATAEKKAANFPVPHPQSDQFNSGERQQPSHAPNPGSNYLRDARVSELEAASLSGNATSHTEKAPQQNVVDPYKTVQSVSEDPYGRFS